MQEYLIPTVQDAAAVFFSMTGKHLLSIKRMATGEQNFVYSVKTSLEEYILRMTRPDLINKFHAAVVWQNLLLPLGVPLAEFIKIDLEAKFSPYPVLLMKRLPGDDLINIYSQLTDLNKKNLAKEIIKIQALCCDLPAGPGYGILNSYDDFSGEKSWYEFLSKKLTLFENSLVKQTIFSPNFAREVICIAQDMKDNFNRVNPTPFLWDASERNVIVFNGKISGIVDVDELCFGDPLLVIALTSVCLELEEHDTIYTGYWAAFLQLSELSQQRLNFYKLFYTLAFMHKHSKQTNNHKKVIFNTQILLNSYHTYLDQINK